MNALQKIKLADIDIQDIVAHPGEYPIELVGATMDVINDMSRQLREAKLRISGHVLAEMDKDGATKIDIIGHDGTKKTIKRKEGDVNADKKAKEKYIEAGFPPEEIGELKFVLSWTRAKKSREYGGDKQELIDQLFKRDKDWLEIK